MRMLDDKDFKYWAFISYSHADAKWGDWLHAALETYRVPSRLVRKAKPEGAVPKRIFPVFRDREELASSSSLGENIQGALRRSRALVVICSPRSAASKWVNEEVKLYKSMGREDRVFCLIADGEPNAPADSGLLECFPQAVRFKVDRDGEISNEPAEPIAADAREGKDGKRNALLKLIAGIIGVPFDELRQRERQRQVRQRIRLGASIVGMLIAAGLIYTAVADAGLNVPLGETIRTSLDRHELSVFRRVHSDAEIRKTAARLRGELVGVFRERLQDGWISAAPLNVNRTSEIWAHSQTLFAIYRMPDHRDAQLEFLPSLETPFASTLEINESHRRYRWLDLDGVEHDKSTPVLWIAAALGAVLATPDLLEGKQREVVLRHCEYVQEILKEYHPTNSGGWNMLPSQKDPNKHHLYTTTLALLALLQAHQANIAWEGGAEHRDQLIRQTAQWLVDHFDPKGEPPGWRGIGEDTLEIYDGLTIQIFAELLQTQKALPDFSIPPAMLQEIPRQLALFARRDLSFPVNGGEFLAQYTRFDGKDGVGRRLIKYLWYPWVIDCSVSWLEFADKQQLPKEERVRVRRALGHLVVDLGDEALKRAQRDYTFFAAEDLYGLTAISPPTH
jgi:TIR domain-containing protein